MKKKIVCRKQDKTKLLKKNGDHSEIFSMIEDG